MKHRNLKNIIYPWPLRTVEKPSTSCHLPGSILRYQFVTQKVAWRWTERTLNLKHLTQEGHQIIWRQDYSVSTFSLSVWTSRYGRQPSAITHCNQVIVTFESCQLVLILALQENLGKLLAAVQLEDRDDFCEKLVDTLKSVKGGKYLQNINYSCEPHVQVWNSSMWVNCVAYRSNLFGRTWKGTGVPLYMCRNWSDLKEIHSCTMSLRKSQRRSTQN